MQHLAQLSHSIMDNSAASKIPVAAMDAGTLLTLRADFAKDALGLLQAHLDKLAPS